MISEPNPPGPLTRYEGDRPQLKHRNSKPAKVHAPQLGLFAPGWTEDSRCPGHPRLTRADREALNRAAGKRERRRQRNIRNFQRENR